jgi:cytochrome P450
MHRALRVASERGPITTHPISGATVVLRHADIEALARDPRLAGVGLVFFDMMGITSGRLREWYGSLMFTNEGETHDRLRTLVSRAFTPRSVEALRKDGAALCDSVFDGVIADGGGDLVSPFALVAMRVMCRLLGVPEEDVEEFGAWADALSPTFGFMDPDQIAAATDAIDALLAYVDGLAERRRSRPADDLISALLAAEDSGDRLTHDELVTMVANLLVAGHDTTTSQIGCSLLTMLAHPESSKRLRAEPDLLVSATEETIRFEPSIPAVPRTVVEPLEVAGTELRPGSLVMLCTAAANREPQTWTEPDRFDVGRFATKGAPRLLSFGAGPHFCLGAALARMTVQECVRAVAERGESMTIDIAPEDVPWRVVLGRSPAELPVTVN